MVQKRGDLASEKEGKRGLKKKLREFNELRDMSLL